MMPTVNEQIADKLDEMATLLETQLATGYRVAAYRRAAGTLRSLAQPVDRIADEHGFEGLTALPGIGRGIAAAIKEILSTGRWSQLERLSGSLEPEQLFQTVPGIGQELAARIHEGLHVDTLEQLEQAAHDGRLQSVSGIGPRRSEAIRATLAERLGHRNVRRSTNVNLPPVGLLLDVDDEYRAKAAAGELRKIAPKRFNPAGEAWLPVLHATRGEWQLTALYSNTRRAHELGKTDDWVVLYFHAGSEPEAQCTIVTENRGALAGRRVVRGREGDCIDHYAEVSRVGSGFT